jgi:excinuclease ABC subunit B
MDGAIKEVNRRRKIQLKYNQDNNIIPQTVVKSIRPQIIEMIKTETKPEWSKIDVSSLTPPQQLKYIKDLKKQMRNFAFTLDFEEAIKIRDKIKELEKI